MHTADLEYFLKILGIEVVARVPVESGDYHWGILYRPTENKILINTGGPNRKLFTYEGFGSE